jgi:hypothetical protein
MKMADIRKLQSAMDNCDVDAIGEVLGFSTRPELREALAALECAETILVLLNKEVKALGCRADYVLPRVQAAIYRLRGLV